MPFLRVLRDKRGYETTYLMHWFREGHRQRSRVLYIFRGPAGVRVGRPPLEPDVLQEIERRYPDIEFDWDAVLEQQQVIEAAPDVRRRKPRRDEKEERPTAVPPELAEASVPERADMSPAEEAVAPPRTPVPSALEGATPDEQIAFLDRVYPLVRERIAQRTTEPARQDVLMTLAERLNPAAWTDADQITAGLQSAAEALDRLSRVLSRRRRRGRKRASAGTDVSAVQPPESLDVTQAGDLDDSQPEEPSQPGEPAPDES